MDDASNTTLLSYQELLHTLLWSWTSDQLPIIQQSIDALQPREQQAVKVIRDRKANQEAAAARGYRQEGYSGASNRACELVHLLMSIKFTKTDASHTDGTINNDDVNKIQHSTLTL